MPLRAAGVRVSVFRKENPGTASASGFFVSGRLFFLRRLFFGGRLFFRRASVFRQAIVFRIASVFPGGLMRFLHTADLHLGRSAGECSLLEDQEHILRQILEVADKRRVDALVVAGDVYDRAMPPAEAVALLDDFLTNLARKGIPVLMIAGNHDSGARLGFGERLFAERGVYIAGAADRGVRRVRIQDTEFWLLPFLRPAAAGASTCQEAVGKLLAEAGKDAQDPGAQDGPGRASASVRRVLVAHQFVTAAGRAPALSDSESTLYVGTLDNVDDSLFRGFAYVALGHLHRPQRIGEGQVYYAGSPLAYSFSESGAAKSVNLVTCRGQGVTVEQIPLRPLRAMRVISGSMEELLAEGARLRAERDPSREDFLRAELADRTVLPNPMGTLRSVYPNLLQVSTRETAETADGESGAGAFCAGADVRRKSVTDTFARFYELVQGHPMDGEQRAYSFRLQSELEGEDAEAGA